MSSTIWYSIAMRPGCLALVLLILLSGGATAVTKDGAGWAVHYNLPDQDTRHATSKNAHEYVIRDVMLRRIKALKRGNHATLATFTLSGGSDCCGAAGPILRAVDKALDRGASVAFVTSSHIDPLKKLGTYSLQDLTSRKSNPLKHYQDRSHRGIMHHKLGLFDYGLGKRWVVVMSWNFTGGASSQQWNIAVELKNEKAYRIYEKEMEEFAAGRFHDHPEKSHKHDGSFTISGGWGKSDVRFAPYVSSRSGGNNAATDILKAIRSAKKEIVFALNRFTVQEIAEALVNATRRGVRVRGVVPNGDTTGKGSSRQVVAYLKKQAARTKGDGVQLLVASSRGDGSTLDAGERDLVHTKYMVIDPTSARPLVIHGSANWTASALIFTDKNDENVCFFRHRGMARAFLDHFNKLTRTSSR